MRPREGGSAMIPRLSGAENLRDYKIVASFEDGKTGVMDLGSWVDRVLTVTAPCWLPRPSSTSGRAA